MIRPHAKAAVRRLVDLGLGIRGLVTVIDIQAGQLEESADVEGRVSLIQAMRSRDIVHVIADAQVRTTSDAIKDWREFLPDEVEAIEKGDAS